MAEEGQMACIMTMQDTLEVDSRLKLIRSLMRVHLAMLYECGASQPASIPPGAQR